MDTQYQNQKIKKAKAVKQKREERKLSAHDFK